MTPYGNRTDKNGFTLLELSIVLIVLSLFITTLLTFVTQNIRRDKSLDITGRLDVIEAALENFRRQNDQLPCPADGSLVATNEYFGIQGGSPGSCNGTPPAPFTDGINTVGGVLPTKTLGLPDEYMFDPWGGRYTYAVDQRMTATAAFTAHPVNDTTIGSITVFDGNGNTRTSSAIAVVVSHGPNGHGAYQLSGQRKSTGSTNTGELTNCHCNSDGTNGTFNSHFVSEPATGLSTDANNNFDDIVRYYTRGQFLSAAEESR